VTEAEFLARCVRCQQCVAACPIDVLQVAPPSFGLSVGTPYVVARDNPCNLCLGRDQMRCIPACPTGALRPLARRRDVKMGVARIDTSTCLPFVGVSCKACWHACPFAREAIGFDPLGRPHVIDEGCVGCGLCVRACLTETTSIHVVPFGARSPDSA
jgi:MauM/NapG family ferredoxin protein